ncbi:GTP-binding protein [Candidatus Woesebacteria bacterium]|nr:GTP-binding protein [Candidatus Woesebacteria bacterium]
MKTSRTRAPIVIVLGHIDHGKTTLLDAIRKTNIVITEAGGITQATGASVVTTKEGKKITFIDTPGHAAFSDMRSRGAKVADIAILVVSADDGVKPQTKEALELIKETQIPVIVAISKIDLPSSDIEGAKGQLEKEGLLFESRGGDTPVVSVSAKKGKGIDELLETISLVAEVHEIKGDPTGSLEAVVIESSRDKRGAFANVIVRNGTLKVGEDIAVENVGSKIRALFNYKGESVREILPGEPAQVIGFNQIPAVGARLIKEGLEPSSFAPTKEVGKKLGKIKEGQIAVILKARSIGSLEALLGSLAPGIIVIDSGVGGVIGSDVLNAKSSNAWIFAFESDVSANVAKLAETEGVHIEKFEVIYELLERLSELLKKGQVEILGKAEILKVFPFNNKRVAGCKVSEGRIAKNDNIIVSRGEKEIGMAKAVSMKRQKNTLIEAKAGEEFGVIFEPQLDFEIGDVLVSVRK